MNVNAPTGPEPRTIEDRVRAVLQALGYPPDEATLTRQIKTFITCNGYHSVLRAARYTASQADREEIRDPWAYTISVYNGNLARLSHLYMLTHWAESGLRSQLDLHYVSAHSAHEVAWHCVPSDYLPANSVTDFVKTHASMGITSRVVPASGSSPARTEIVNPATPGDFLEMVTFGWLLTMVRHLHDQAQGSHILVDPSGRATSRQQARSLLHNAKEARNAVAHHHYVPNSTYDRYKGQIVALLEILHFDVWKAVTRTGEIRSRIVARHLRELKQGQTAPSTGALSRNRGRRRK